MSACSVNFNVLSIHIYTRTDIVMRCVEVMGWICRVLRIENGECRETELR